MYRYKHTNQSRHICDGVGALSLENISVTLIKYDRIVISVQLITLVINLNKKYIHLMMIKNWFTRRKNNDQILLIFACLFRPESLEKNRSTLFRV